jgi:hypothetical protein
MATTAQWFPQSGELLIARYWTTQDMSVMLMKNTYTPDPDGHLRYADVSSQELAAGGGYTVGGKSITGKSVSYVPASDETNLIGADLSWGPGATFQTRYGIIYENGTADEFLWALLDFGALQDIANGTFLLDWASNLLAIGIGPPV